uniref:Putative JAB1/MPN/MOV34 metalloenzyme domain-containing protein n=1 Tax=Helianthus annuus TaxID=4232 RepID=A0A251VS63_HELAN
MVNISVTVEILNNFELLYDPYTHFLDRPFLEKKQELYKKVFTNFYILGWYSTDADAEESDMLIHKAYNTKGLNCRNNSFLGLQVEQIRRKTPCYRDEIGQNNVTLVIRDKTRVKMMEVSRKSGHVTQANGEGSLVFTHVV